MATQYPTEQEEFSWEVEGLQEGFKKFLAGQVVALKDLEDKGILTKEQADKVREALRLKKVDQT